MSRFSDITDDVNAQSSTLSKFDMSYPPEWHELQFDVVDSFLDPPSEWIEAAKDAGAAIFAKRGQDYHYDVIMRAFGPSIPIFGQARRLVVEIIVRRFPIGKWPVILVDTHFEGRERQNDKLPKSLFAYYHHQFSIIQEAMAQTHDWALSFYKDHEAPHFASSITAYKKALEVKQTVTASVIRESAGVTPKNLFKRPFPDIKRAVANSSSSAQLAKFPTLMAEKKANELLRHATVTEPEEELATELDEREQLAEVTYGNEYTPALPVKRRIFHD